MLTLGRVLAVSSPDGKGMLTYVIPGAEVGQELFPQSVSQLLTYTGTAYGEDEKCMCTLFFEDPFLAMA